MFTSRYWYDFALLCVIKHIELCTRDITRKLSHFSRIVSSNTAQNRIGHMDYDIGIRIRIEQNLWMNEWMDTWMDALTSGRLHYLTNDLRNHYMKIKLHRGQHSSFAHKQYTLILPLCSRSCILVALTAKPRVSWLWWHISKKMKIILIP